MSLPPHDAVPRALRLRESRVVVWLPQVLLVWVGRTAADAGGANRGRPVGVQDVSAEGPAPLSTIPRLAWLAALFLAAGWQTHAEGTLLELAAWLAVAERRPEAKA